MYFSDLTAAVPDMTEYTYEQFEFQKKIVFKTIVSKQLMEDNFV